ncbi:hypothetical protein [Bacteroides pyogenes]|nr:hypothetical protein [Bacteroides pyogenes]MBB3895736.1 hypothetical protein [Bacteroides pyogenes]SUV33399.1 Uncharacterised protein [Bacteroides pyogenes]
MNFDESQMQQRVAETEEVAIAPTGLKYMSLPGFTQEMPDGCVGLRFDDRLLVRTIQPISPFRQNVTYGCDFSLKKNIVRTY